MVKEVLKNVFRIEVPLPRNPLKALNSYLIKGKSRSLLVDTGFNWPECKEAQINGLAHLAIDWSEVDFFLTHVHADHSGLIHELATPESHVYCNQIDWDLLKASMSHNYWEQTKSFLLIHGFPVQDIGDQTVTIIDYISGTDVNCCFVRNEETLTVGGYNFVCIETPGHSPGHMCLYEPEHRFLFSGDHILADISSNITSWNDGNDYLGLYLQSLDRVYALDIKTVLPGHRGIIKDHRQRISELTHHHRNRLQEIKDLLRKSSMTAYEVASYMNWDVSYDSWQELSRYQRWFATGEAIAHLEHLCCRGEAVKDNQGSQVVFSLPL